MLCIIWPSTNRQQRNRMFFEIISPTGNKNYLLGTVHFNDKEIVTLPLEVKNAFDNASRVVIEADLAQAEEAFLHWIMKWMKNNQIISAPPMFISFLEVKQALDPRRFEKSLDQLLIDECKLKGKPLGFLEVVDEQVKAVIGYSFNKYEQASYYQWLKDNGLLDVEYINKQSEKLKTYYLANNLDAIAEVLSLPLNAPEIAYKFNKSMFADRDIIQAEAMKQFMEEGNVFFAVGALHLIGIIDKLKAEGYTVNPISLSQRMYPISDCKQTLFHPPRVKEDEMHISPQLGQHSESKICQNLDSSQKDPKNVPDDQSSHCPGLG